jgi:hypothetical protein
MIESHSIILNIYERADYVILEDRYVHKWLKVVVIMHYGVVRSSITFNNLMGWKYLG